MRLEGIDNGLAAPHWETMVMPMHRNPTFQTRYRERVNAAAGGGLAYAKSPQLQSAGHAFLPYSKVAGRRSSWLCHPMPGLASR
jgi:hypothetical protein